MSDYHVMESEKNDRVKVAFHIVVPDELNIAGCNLRTAVSEWMSTQESVTKVPWLQSDFSTEYQDLVNGVKYEWSIEVVYSANLNDVGIRDVLDAKYSALAITIPNIIRRRFRRWKYNRDV